VIFSTASARCFGLCPEEQTALQLRARGVDLRPLPWNAYLAEAPCASNVRGLRPLVNETACARLGCAPTQLPCRNLPGDTPTRRAWCRAMRPRWLAADASPVPPKTPPAACSCAEQRTSITRAAPRTSITRRTRFRARGEY